ncbi:MAG: MFS transporter [Candidatus Micrarchaeota archaeon]|nr:MFS transporter [Candidatus Micrarchaeota archaeon]
MEGIGGGEGLSDKERKSSMRLITAEGMAYSAMAGSGDAYVSAAAVALGASNFYIGTLTALPHFVGALFQFGSLSALRIAKNRKMLVMIGCLLQALTWLPVVAALVWPSEISVELIILFFSLGSGFSLFINPAWSSWVSDIVPENERARYFANRNRLMQFTLFAVTFLAGVALNWLEVSIGARLAFAVAFFFAFLARFSTVFLHWKTADVKYEIQLIKEIGMKHLFLLPAYRHELWFLWFVALMSFAVQFASPFFTPYILENLNYDVGTLGVLTAVAVLAKIVSFPYWGKIIDRFGNRTALIACAYAAPFVPFLWLLSGNFWMLVLFQLYSGFVWSGYDLAVFNYALSLVSRELRPSFMSKYNIFSGVFYAAGALAGGAFLQLFGDVSFLGYSGILLVFLISTLMRLTVVLLFTPRLAEGGHEPQNTSQERAVIFDIVAVYPTQGAVHHALDGWNFTRKAVESTVRHGSRIIKTGISTTGEMLKNGSRKIISHLPKRRGL